MKCDKSEVTCAEDVDAILRLAANNFSLSLERWINKITELSLRDFILDSSLFVELILLFQIT